MSQGFVYEQARTFFPKGDLSRKKYDDDDDMKKGNDFCFVLFLLFPLYEFTCHHLNKS